MNRKKRQDQILNTALKVFASKGYQATTISELVTHAKVSRGTFYLYYQSKKDIFDALLNRFFHPLTQIISSFHINPKTYQDDGDVSSFSQELAHLLANNHLLAKIAWTKSQELHQSHREFIKEQTHQIQQLLNHRFADLAKAFSFTSCDSKILAMSFWGTIKEMTLDDSNEIIKLAIAEKTTSYLNFLIDGLAKQPAITQQDSIRPHQEVYQENSTHKSNFH